MEDDRDQLVAKSSNIQDNDDEVQLKTYNKWSLVDPRSVLHRFIVLIFMCFLGFGSYFCYDNPGALQNEMIDDMHINTSQFSLLYSWYSWPNVILSFLGGFLIDRVFGIRLGAIIFSVFILVGQLVFALGATVNIFYVMILGRFIFGIGGESLAVAQNTYAVSWFKGKELNMVFGLQLSFARVGSTVNYDCMVAVYNYFATMFEGYKCLGVTLFAAALTCLLSQICACVIAMFDWRAEKILKRSSGQTGEVVKITDVKHFPLSFWLMSVICVAYYVAIFPFVGLGSVFFQRKYNYDPTGANVVDSIVYVISAFASPVFGLLVDRVGYNLTWVLAAIIVTLCSHILLAFSFIPPLWGMVPMGLSYSLLACGLWPMVSLEIPERQLGTAYGVMQSVQNLGLALITMAAGSIVDNKGYFVLEIFFQAWLSVAIMAVMILFVVNTRRGGILNLSVKERKLREEEEKKRLEEDSSEERLISPEDLLQSLEPSMRTKSE